MKRDYKKLPVNYAEPNWHHSAPGIGCKVDWAGAHVFEFPRSHVGPVRIIAYTLRDAVAVLDGLESESEMKWAEGRDIQETFA